MNIAHRIQYYHQLIDDNNIYISQLKKQIYLNGTFRLILFCAIIGLIYIFNGNLSILLPAVLLIAIAFTILLKRHNRLSEKKETAEILLRIAEDELKAFNYDFSAFDGAPEKIDATHPFSFDLDIFGKQSIFQQINRTCLPIGKERLAQIIRIPLTEKTAIQDQQKAIKELSEKEDFCLRFRSIGLKMGEAKTQNKIGFSALDKKDSLTQNSFWKIAIGITPFLYVVFFVLWLMGIVSGGMFTSLYIFTLALSVMPMKRVRAIWQTFDKKTKVLNAYFELLKTVEQENIQSPLLLSLKNRLIGQEKASQAIKKVSKYSHNLDVGFTIAILVLNPVFLWTTRYALKIEEWVKKYSHQSEEWFTVLAEMDALISLGTFAANHPDYVYPEISDHFCFNGEDLGHPLIPREKCVKNNINITQKTFFMIVTGANMAGKSTYLRTIGVNHVLASIGLPVCAKKLLFYPGKLLTNLRTADSLINSESYFFAELKRLKMIIDRLESGEDGLFIILDEILKGTNSEDKQKGSFALMKRLINLGGNGIIATHDLALGNLESVFPKGIKNHHFDATLKHNTLTFDYKLKEGIAQNMNASFLMQKMGITEAVG